MNYTQSFSIKKWAESDRPREKLLQNGKTTLSHAELIAILIGSGNREESAVELARRILVSSDNKLNEISRKSVKEFTVFKGIGEAKAIAIVAALELGRRRRSEGALKRTKINSSDSVYELIKPEIGDLNHEEFWIIYLNNSNKVLDKAQLSKGGITGTMVDVRLVYKSALEKGATGIILAHNHPSGKLRPSQPDRKLTAKLKRAGENLDIKVLDHLIVTQNDYYSFANEGIL